MKGYVDNIATRTDENTDYRRVVYSGSKLQLVLMALAPGEEIGGKIHTETDRFFRIESGRGRVVIDGVTHKIQSGDCVVVPGGVHHNLICTGHETLKFYTIYGPPHHRDQLVHATRADADASKEGFDGTATEHEAPPVLV